MANTPGVNNVRNILEVDKVPNNLEVDNVISACQLTVETFLDFLSDHEVTIR